MSVEHLLHGSHCARSQSDVKASPLWYRGGCELPEVPGAVAEPGWAPASCLPSECSLTTLLLHPAALGSVFLAAPEWGPQSINQET